MNCKDFRELIDSYLSDELLTETNHEVLSHLENCANCRTIIEARREVRQHLRSAVLNAPQYQIGKNFSHNLRTQLQYEALKNEKAKANAWFGLKSLIPIAIGLILVFTGGFFFFNYSNEATEADRSSYQTDKFSSNHLVNVAFGDHEHCAIKKGTEEPVKAVETPAKYADAEQIAMPNIKKILVDAQIKTKHTCEYRNTKFTHLIMEKDNKLVSVMMTDKINGERLGEDIAVYSSQKYRLARFDVKDTAIFVISDFDEQTNFKAAQSIYQPFREHLNNANSFQTALLINY